MPTSPNPDDGKPGRRARISPELIALVVKLILAGNFRTVAGKAVGLPPRTFRDWLRRGRLYPEGLYGEFREKVLAAEVEAEKRAVAVILAAAHEDAKHAQWWLERKYPARWSRHRGELAEVKRELAELKRLIGAAEPVEPAP